MKKIIKSYHRSKISFWNSINTEWNAIKNDKAIIGVFLSIALLILVAYTFVYSNQVVEKVPVGIVNQDASKLSRDYIAMLNSGDGLKANAIYSDLQDAKVAYYENEIKGIIIIPHDFEKNIKSGKQVTITTFSDASNMLFYKKVLGTVTTINGYFNVGIIIKKDISKGMSYKQAVENYTPIKSVSNSLFNISGGYATYLIPMLTALIIQLVLLMGIGLINGTRNEDRSMKSHFPRLAHKGGTIPVLLGKAILYTFLYLIIIPIQIGIIYTLFSIPIRSSLITVYIFIIPYVFSVVFLGIVISSFFKRREDSLLFIVLTSIPSLMLSGLSFPSEGFSKFYQIIAQLIPSTHGIEGFVKLTQMKASFIEISTEWYKLWGLTLLYFIMASFLLKLKVKKTDVKLIKD
ncbi:ABC transporter permease [Yeosuana marina]|uniref:ABC transporter permease n=1 Tax=Yeosuana marina TaxID=1565536 RepID=UPI0030C85244